MDRLKAVLAALDGDKSKLVIDLSCRRQGERWVVAMNKWKTLTDMEVNSGRHLEAMSFKYCVNVNRCANILGQNASNSWSHTALNSWFMRRMSRACKRASMKPW